MNLDLTLSKELLPAWSEYCGEVDKRNEALTRKYERELKTFRKRMKQAVEEWRKIEEDEREQERKLDDKYREQYRAYKALPWWKLKPIYSPRSPESKEYKDYWAQKLAVANNISSLYSELTRPNPPAKPQYEEKTVEAFLTWLADQKADTQPEGGE